MNMKDIKSYFVTLVNYETELISERYEYLSDRNPVQAAELDLTFQKSHCDILGTLISRYMKEKCPWYSDSMYSEYFVGDFTPIEQIISDFPIDYVPSLCELLHVNYLNSEIVLSNGIIKRKKSKKNLLKNGAVYTQDEIAYSIVKRTLSKFSDDELDNIKILDFAIGTGRFYRQILRVLTERSTMPIDDVIVNNIYGVDIDGIAVNISRLFAMSQLSDKSIAKFKKVSKNIICKNALIREQLFDNNAITSKDCNGLFFNGFDAIVSNPPYLVLKPNKNKMDKETVDEINQMAKYFRNSHFYKYSIEGMLNLYQLSIESMIHMLKDNGEMGIICPSTLFADISTAKLRKYMLSRHKISYIKYFSEDDPLFDNITQATCIFHLSKNGRTTSIEIEQCNRNFNISIDNVKRLFSENWEIPSIDKIEWDILAKLESQKKVKDCSYIRNKRGELDLTLYKGYITSSPTKLRLVRGNMLTENGIIDKNKEYVSLDFLKKKSSDYMKFDYGRKRLVCQQISNQTQRVRLKFLISDENDILGNSCNYITVPIDIISIVSVLLNSALLNWRFKITSTNNHINNYELDELPMINIEEMPASIVDSLPLDRDRVICKLYGLNELETNYIIKQYYETI